jgi:hypothetical protein
MKKKKSDQKDVNESIKPDITNRNDETEAIDFDVFPEIKPTSEDLRHDEPEPGHPDRTQ